MNHDSILSVIVIAFFLGSSLRPATSQSLAEGLTLYEAGDIAAAQSVFAGLAAKDPDNAEVIYHLGLTQMAQDNIDAAIDSFERAVDLDANQSRYFQLLGEALGSKAGNVGPLKQMAMAGRIHDAFENAVELDGNNIDARFGLITYYLNAPAIAGGSVEKAMRQAEAIQRLDAIRGQIALASVYSDQGQFDKAEAAYRQAIAGSPGEQDPYLALGIQLTGQERYADAIAVYAAGLEKLPDNMSINYQVGRTASISGQFLDQGRLALEAYISRYKPRADEPSLAWASYRLGLILQHLGRIDQARAAFKAALNMDPKHKEAKKALRSIH